MSGRQAALVLFACFSISLLHAQKPSAPPAQNHQAFSEIPGSVRHIADRDNGEYVNPNISVEVVLAPEHESDLNGLLSSVYDPQSPDYHQWLGKGEFETRFAPSASRVAALADYLHSRGLVVEPTASPFLLRATGSSKDVAAAFHTSLSSYRNRSGIPYFSNREAVHLPTSLGRERARRSWAHQHGPPPPHAGAAWKTGIIERSLNSRKERGLSWSLQPYSGCEEPYPTAADWFAYVDSGTLIPYGYGGGPDCSGLTPSQLNSLYGAPSLGRSAQGRGVTLAVVEFSAYRPSDTLVWAHDFYGPSFAPPLEDIIVDGGPLNRSSVRLERVFG